MKMGTIRSLCPYDAAARYTLQSAKLRRAAILHYALWGLSAGYRKWSGYSSLAAMPSNPGVDIMCHKLPSA